MSSVRIDVGAHRRGERMGGVDQQRDRVLLEIGREPLGAAKPADPDRALAALFAPPGVRDDLFALYAVNAELARIAGRVMGPRSGIARALFFEVSSLSPDALPGADLEEHLHDVAEQPPDGGVDPPLLGRDQDLPDRRVVGGQSGHPSLAAASPPDMLVSRKALI